MLVFGDGVQILGYRILEFEKFDLVFRVFLWRLVLRVWKVEFGILNLGFWARD